MGQDMQKDLVKRNEKHGEGSRKYKLPRTIMPKVDEELTSYINWANKKENYSHITKLLKNIDVQSTRKKFKDSQGSDACISKMTKQKTRMKQQNKVVADDYTDQINSYVDSQVTLRKHDNVRKQKTLNYERIKRN